MKLRRLVIRVQTSDGTYGNDIEFPDGLVVVWADNSMGKSTCVKAILIALGMEAMLTTSRSDVTVHAPDSEGLGWGVHLALTAPATKSNTFRDC